MNMAMATEQLSNRILRGLVIAPIRFYQYAISPYTPAACRHVPSCSEYSVQAIRQHGAFTGGRIAASRIARCHPWGTSGFDPVPKFLIKKLNMKKYRSGRKFPATDLLKQKTLLLLTLISILLTASCNQGSKKQAESNEKHVLVSIVPQKYFVEQIAGNDFRVSVLIPPGASPHAYDPTPKQMMQIAGAGIYFYNGNLSFEEAWIGNLQDSYPNMKTISTSKGIPLIETGEMIAHGDHFHHGTDPHTWLSPENAQTIAANILVGLSGEYPELKDTLKENYLSFVQKTDSLKHQIRAMLKDLPERKFMIFHPSLSYFARDYGLEQIPIETEGKEPSPAQLKETIKKARSANIRTIFIQQEFDSENARIIAEEIGGKVVQIDPLAENWDQNLIRIARAISGSYEKQTGGK